MSFLSRLFNSKARAAERELERRVAAFHAEVMSERLTPDRARLEALRGRAARLNLSDDDVALELELVDGLLEVLRMKQEAAAGSPLPLVETSHRALAGEVCYFAAPSFRPDLPNDNGGKLFLTERRLLYLGASQASVSWAHVAEVLDSERDLVVRLRQGTVRTFRCNSYVDTLRGAYIASRLLSR